MEDIIKNIEEQIKVLELDKDHIDTKLESLRTALNALKFPSDKKFDVGFNSLRSIDDKIFYCLKDLGKASIEDIVNYIFQKQPTIGEKDKITSSVTTRLSINKKGKKIDSSKISGRPTIYFISNKENVD